MITVHIAEWFRDLPDDALYRSYAAGPENEPQPVALHLDRNTGEAWAEIVAEVGPGRPRDETTVLCEIPSTTVAAAIHCLEDMTPALQANLDGTPEPDSATWAQRAETTQAGEPWPRYADPVEIDGYFSEPYSEGVSAATTDDELRVLAGQMSEPIADVAERISPRAALGIPERNPGRAPCGATMTTTMTTPPCVSHTPGWLAAAEADVLLATLTRAIPWEQQTLQMYGREVNTPRLTCWFGDASYTYSGTTNVAHAWLPELEALRVLLEITTAARFNSCLANLYRDGRDGVSWHSDDEPELGVNPTIASISLGDTTDFKLRDEATREVATIPLGHGDLVVMRDDSQEAWRHSIPKRAHAGARINLTFRYYTEEAP